MTTHIIQNSNDQNKSKNAYVDEGCAIYNNKSAGKIEYRTNLLFMKFIQKLSFKYIFFMDGILKEYLVFFPPKLRHWKVTRAAFKKLRACRCFCCDHFIYDVCMFIYVWEFKTRRLRQMALCSLFNWPFRLLRFFGPESRPLLNRVLFHRCHCLRFWGNCAILQRLRQIAFWIAITFSSEGNCGISLWESTYISLNRLLRGDTCTSFCRTFD